MERLHAILLQQDSAASPHFSHHVVQFLNEIFSHPWLGRSGQISWPLKRPDLTLLDSLVNMFSKSQVYTTIITNSMDLKFYGNHLRLLILTRHEKCG